MIDYESNQELLYQIAIKKKFGSRLRNIQDL